MGMYELITLNLEIDTLSSLGLNSIRINHNHLSHQTLRVVDLH
jgi:hypothetical protein